MKSKVVFQERDILQDILVLEKDIVKTYGSSIIETSCQNMRSVLEKNMMESADDQFGVFNAMHKRGYYATKKALPQAVQESKTKFQGMKNCMN